MNKKDIKTIDEMIKKTTDELIETANKFVATECEIKIEVLNEVKSKLGVQPK